MTRGYSAIGLVRPKERGNVGGVMRAAHCFGAAMVAVEGQRGRVTSAEDTTKAWRHLPVLRGDDLFAFCPVDATPIAVELDDSAVSLVEFTHPERAFYIFGPEDGSLGQEHLFRCAVCLVIPTAFCLNLAAAVNVVLYDRAAKDGRR